MMYSKEALANIVFCRVCEALLGIDSAEDSYTSPMQLGQRLETKRTEHKGALKYGGSGSSNSTHEY